MSVITLNHPPSPNIFVIDLERLSFTKIDDSLLNEASRMPDFVKKTPDHWLINTEKTLTWLAESETTQHFHYLLRMALARGFNFVMIKNKK